MKEKIALVTAATRGIGWAAAHRLAEAGMTVYVASIPQELAKAEETLQACRAEGLKLFGVAYDAFDKESYQPMIDQVVAEAGGLDILVNNFGHTEMDKDVGIDKIKYDDFERLVNLNLQNVILPTQLALPHLKKNGGSIINISSIGGKVPDVTELAYGTAKAAICHITKMVATQLARYGIRCNAILPGIVATDAVKRALPPDYQKTFLRHVPLGRMAEPDEIGSAVLFLAENPYVTGQLLEISGGFGTATPLYADTLSPL